jgi:hypothetical protein
LWRRPRPKLGCGAKERRRFHISVFHMGCYVGIISNARDLLYTPVGESDDTVFVQSSIAYRIIGTIDTGKEISQL